MGTSNTKRIIEVAGSVATVLWLYNMAKEAAPSSGTSKIARLDDEVSPIPEPNSYAVMYGDGSPDYSGMSGLGDVAREYRIELTDEPTAPLKLRRMVVVRAGETADPAALRVITQNTRQRAGRANHDIPGIVRNVVKRFGPWLQDAAALHNVPASLLATKMSIENPNLLTKVVTGGGATGLMQIAPGTADDCLRTEFRNKNLLGPEVEFFRAHLGSRFAAMLAGKRGHTTADLQNPEYCIHIGALAFGQYLRKYVTADGEVQVFKAAAHYNRGDRAMYANARVNSPDALIGYKGPGKYSTPKTTQQYIMLYCGPNGPLDYITRNNLLA